MSQVIYQILNDIEVQLQQLDRWSPLPPDVSAMASTLPFCYDTMPLEQWIQYLLLPRLRAMLDAGVPLPTKVSILPVAEESFKTLGVAAYPLLQLISELDKTLTGEQ